MQKLDKAKSYLMFKHPFFGALATKIEIKENNYINSYSFRGDSLEINKEFIEQLSIDEIGSILAGSALFQALFHSNRGDGKIKSIWQAASEFAINDILVKNSFILPPLAKYKAAFEGMYAEQIYNILLEKNQKFEEIKLEKKINNLDYNIFSSKLIKKFSNSNELPIDIERIFKAKSSQLSWRELLKRYINLYAKVDYTLFPSNKKYLWQGLVLPSINSTIIEIAIAIDTSASISKESLDIFLKEIEAIMQSFKNYKILLIEADNKIQHISTITPLIPLKTTFKGGGGTDFRAVFNYFEKSFKKPQLLIYFSDANGIFPTKRPFFNILWVLNKDNEVPFGQKIVIK